MQRINGHFVNTEATNTRVQITDGTYRNQPVAGTFLMVRDVKEGKRGDRFITVQMIQDGHRLPSLPDDVDINRTFRVTLPQDAAGYTVISESEANDIMAAASKPKGRMILATEYCQTQGLKYDSFRKTKTFQAMKVKGEDGRLYVNA